MERISGKVKFQFFVKFVYNNLKASNKIICRMKIRKDVGQQFINPYRQNRRSFNKYFSNSSFVKSSLDKYPTQKRTDLLDNISKTSSKKIVQNQLELIDYTPNVKFKQEPLGFYFMVANKQKKQQTENPQIYQIVSKHVDLIMKKKKKQTKSSQKNKNDFCVSKTNAKSFSVQKFQRTPKITEFSRQTFYRNVSTSKSNFWSKKQQEDFLHSKSNFDINKNKLSIFKSTKPWGQGRNFVSYEIYIIDKRVGLDVIILRGASKQIKFRLIMNQEDSKIFQKYWVSKVDEFLDKCLVIKEQGLGLRVGFFNNQKYEQKKTNSTKQSKKTYLKNYESFIQKKIKQKFNTFRVGGIVFCREYHSHNNIKKNKNSSFQSTSAFHQNVQIKKQREIMGHTQEKSLDQYLEQKIKTKSTPNEVIHEQTIVFPHKLNAPLETEQDSKIQIFE